MKKNSLTFTLMILLITFNMVKVFGQGCQVQVSISSNLGNVICSDYNVTYTATPTNGGSSPVYQWKKNGTNVGTNSNIYANNSLTNGDQITCVLTSSLSCTNNPATSNTITMTVYVKDDGSLCTADFCSPGSGTITHIALNYDDGVPCTTDGCNSLTGIFHTPNNCGPTLEAQILIEGLYNMNGEMFYPLGNLNDPNFTYYDVDTVYISAMNPTSPYAEVFRQSAILKGDGDIDIIFGPAVTVNNYYYLKVNHHNSLETWSAAPVQLTSTTTYSFVSAASQAFGSNEIETYDHNGYAIYTGDVTQDGAIDGSDFLELDPYIQNGYSGYSIYDLNGDLNVDATDFLIQDVNIQNGVSFSTP